MAPYEKVSETANICKIIIVTGTAGLFALLKSDGQHIN